MSLTNGQQALYACANYQQNFGFTLDPGGLPDGADGFINFSDLTFYTDGGTEEIGDILSDDATFGSFDIENVVEGTGLIGGPTSKPRIIGTPAAQILAGSTMVFDYTFVAGLDSYYTVTIYDDPDFNVTWGCGLASTEAGFDSNISATPPSTTFADSALGAHRGALTISATGAKISVDGGAVVADAGDAGDFAALNAIGMEVNAHAILLSIAIYPPMSNAEMQAASAL